jgi:hypothetical protein
VLHKGQAGLEGNKLKPLICVGAAYFIVAIIVPALILAAQGKLGGGWSFSGVTWSLMAGSAGALGALGIILALTSGGKPIYVMPLVFGCAPVVNVFVSMYFAKIPLRNVSPIFIAGMILVSVGAVTVLVFQPRADKSTHAPAKASASVDKPSAVAASEAANANPATSPATEQDPAAAD